ncbi:2-methylcitrate dehydratase [Lampropedia hyalina DSM 16112]|jgi:2-methylcitrate dehydratase|uniref:2-methylcitrate dehydratase n=1 Tax=Lampropedia hyalina DSM 16112 TaxID=1122156 RepID=A0A1M4X658_9BURK|nr:MmgE/PrpD family protein [Lampropedia hyalina]SHE88927.1 2-methylcitrate dehydratase [Lampropedia hyalina DSM 16112]
MAHAAPAHQATEVAQLAEFVASADHRNMSDAAREELKKRILDSIGVAIGALDGKPIGYIRTHQEDFGGNPLCTLIGGGKTAPDRAAFYNGALVRYLDFMDSYLAKGETCHQSDNLGAVLAAAEYANQDGDVLLSALAVAYQVQGRLCDVAPVRAKGFDHTVQGAYAVAAGVARALGLDAVKTANAIAISGTSNNALRVTRTGALSHWKGLAYPHTAFIGTHAAFLAYRGITGPAEVFEGNKGFKEAIAGPFEIDWRKEDLENVRKSIIKRYNAEIHSQSSIEGAIELQAAKGFNGSDIERLDIEIFDVAYHIIGGGEEGDKTIIRNKEEADHSLQYMVAVALLDGNVLPAQYEQERIVRADVQDLLHRVKVRPKQEYTDRFPGEVVTTLTFTLKDGSQHRITKTDYEGFHTRPMGWETVIAKFTGLATPFTSEKVRDQIVDAVRNLEHIRVSELTAILADLKA